MAHSLELSSISVCTPVWIAQVLSSYDNDPEAQSLLTELAVTSPNSSGYTLQQGLIYKNRRLWVGNNSGLQTRIISAFDSSTIGGHSGI